MPHPFERPNRTVSLKKIFIGSSLLIAVGGIVMLSMPQAKTSAPSEMPSGPIPIYDNQSGKTISKERVQKTDAEWRKQLTPLQYHVTREEGTERAYSGPYHANKAEGIYRCIGCGTDLYSSQTKYDSRTGWPSFWEPVSEQNVGYEIDKRFGMNRTEVHCALCRAHLGHVFKDGPAPTYKRHCINSASLQFDEIAS